MVVMKVDNFNPSKQPVLYILFTVKLVKCTVLQA